MMFAGTILRGGLKEDGVCRGGERVQRIAAERKGALTEPGKRGKKLY